MMEKQIMELNKRYARKKMLKRIVALLCVFVMLFTVNSLKMVAQTLTRTPMCGLKEHQHKAKCYDASGNLVCGKVEHQHTDACYQESPTLEIEDDAALPVDGLQVDGGLDLDLDAGSLDSNALDLNNDLVVEDVATPVANEAPVTPTYVFGSKALLSNIIESTGLNIKIKKIKEVGLVDNDGSQVGLVEITKKDNGDYRIKALRDFDQVELAIVLADEVVVVKLLDGVAPAEPVVEEPAAPQVEEAQPAPAVEVEQPEQPAPADESEQPELTVPETEDEQIELAEQPEPAVTEEQADLNVEDAQVEQEEVPAAEEMQIEAPVVEDAQVETPVVEEVEPEQPEAPAQEEEAEPTEAPAEEEAAEPEPTEAPVVEEPAEPEQIEAPVAEEEPTEVATTEEEPTEVPAVEEPVEASVDEEAVPQQTEASALAGEIEAPVVEEAAAPELADADLTVDVPADEAAATEPTEPEQTVSVEEPEVQIEETAAEETATEEIATEETATEEKAAEEIASIEAEAVEPAPADAQAEQGDAAEEPAPADEQAEQEDATEEPAPAEEQAEQGDATEDEAAEPALAEAQAPQEDGEEAAEIEGEETAQEEIDQLPVAVDAETADGEAGEPEQDEAAVYTAGSREIPVNDAVVTLTWPVEAKIPEDVVITIEEIEKGTEDYDLLYHQALAELPEPDQAVTQVMRFFDITLYTADGQKIEPKAPVSVVVSVNETIDSEVSALHCEEVGAPMETVDANAEGESVAFDAPSFSVYGVNYQVPAEQENVSSQVQVDLSRVDTMGAATVDGMSVSLSVADLLAGTDDAVESTVDSTVDAEQFVAEATVSSPDVTVQDGTITLPADALEKATVQLQVETKETGKDYITTVTTHTVDIVLSDYAGRTEEATGEGVTVKAVGENSLPADAKASVEENVAVPESVEVGENESATAFDINLTNANGDAITGPVAVTVMPSDLNVLADVPEGAVAKNVVYTLVHVHDDGTVENVELPADAVVVGEDGKVESFSFETESFSTYVLKYTVDFHYGEEEVSIEGETQVLLSTLIKQLGIKDENGEFIDVANVASVSFSDERLVTVEEVSGEVEVNGETVDVGEKDFLLTSKEPFTSKEQLILTMIDESKVVVCVTDEQALDITSLLTGVSITENGTPVASDATLIKDKVYDIKLSFQETDSLQFVDDDAEMYYTLPSNITVPNDSGTFDMEFGSFGKVQGNTYSIENGVLKIHWNISDPNMGILRALDEAHFDVNIKVKFGENSKVIQWNEHIKTSMDVTEAHDANVSKVGNYDATTGKIYYTVTVNSTGTTTDIKVTDEITGSALTSDVKSLSDLEIKNKNGEVVTVTADKLTVDGNKFVLELPNMADGDQYVIKYSASVNYDQLGKSGKTTYLETNNGVKVEWDESDKPSEDNSYEYDIYFSELSKEAKTISDVYEKDGKKYRDITWKIEANGSRKVPVTYITDNIRADSTDIMKMSGTGITVVVNKEDGTSITREIPWNNTNNALGTIEKTDASWTYRPPTSDGKASYQISYQTTAEVTTLSKARNVNNDVEDDWGKTGNGTSVGPDGEVGITKTATSVNEEEVTWSIDVSIPKSGTTETRIVDVLPTGNNEYWDKYKSCVVSGLDTSAGESYDVTFKFRSYYDPWNYNTYIAEAPTNEADFAEEVYINFYYTDTNGNKVNGFRNNNTERTIHVDVITENNSDWLDAAAGDVNTYGNHTNTVKIGEISATSTVQPSHKKVTKTYVQTKKVTIDGIEYTVYQYKLVLQGITDGSLQIFDTFDTDVFELLTVEESMDDEIKTWHSGIGHGDNVYIFNVNDSHKATLTPTKDGILISTTDLDKTNSGAYYAAYRIDYYLVMKHPEKAAKKAFDAGGKTTFTNSVNWDGATSHVDIEYGHPILDKQVAVNDNKAHYTITINPDKMSLGATDGDGHYPEFLTLTDTFSSSLSIVYDSISVTVDDVKDTAHTVEYDYSGNVGTFKVPNNTKVVISYDCNIIKNGKDMVQIWNEANLNGDFVVSSEKYVDVTSSASGGGKLIAIKLLKYRENHMEAGPLAGATFRILDSEKNPIVVTARAKDPDSHVGDPITFTTDASSAVTILLSRYTHGVTLKKNTVYYLEEIKAPAGYQLDPTLYSFVISDDPNHANYTREDGVWVYYVGDILKVRNTPEKLQLTLYKRFEGNVALTDEQKQNIKFTVIRVDEDGNEVANGFRKVINYTDLRYDKYTITEQDDGFVPGYYKVIEEHADATSLGLSSNVVAETSYSVTTNGTTVDGISTTVEKAQVVSGKGTNVIFVNKYSTGAYYFNKIEAGTEEQPLGGAEFTVYDTNDTQITKYTTGDDGKFMISRQGGAESLFQENTLYYVMETKAPDGFSIPDPAPTYYFFFGDGDVSHIPAGATENKAVNLYDGSRSENIVNASDTSIMVEKVWIHKDGSAMSDTETKDLYAKVTLHRKISKLQGTKVNVRITDANTDRTKTFIVETGCRVTLDWNNWYSNVKFNGEGDGIKEYSFTATGEVYDVYFTNTEWNGGALDNMQCDYTPATTYSDPEVDASYHSTKTLTLADGWYYAWDKLDKTDADGNPYSYYITEDEKPDGYQFKSYSTNNDAGIQSGTITVTNEKEEEETGDLKVSKTVASGDTNKEFTFKVTLGNTSINGTFGDMTFTNGVATFTLKHNQSKTATGLPNGVGYTVEETAAGGYTATYTGKTGTIVAGTMKEAEVSNSYDASGKTTFDGVKEIVNRYFKAGDTLTVSITSSDGKLPNPSSKTVDLVAGQSTANFSFDEVTYTYADIADSAASPKSKIFHYTVTETATMAGTTPDTKTHTIEVTVTDKGDGTLDVQKVYKVKDGDAEAVSEDKTTFVNTYSASNTAQILGTKAMRPATESPAGYQFSLTAENGTPMPASGGESATSGSDGKFEFGPITYTMTQVKADGTLNNETSTYTAIYYYKVKEVVPAPAVTTEEQNAGYAIRNGIKYDLSEKPATVTVTYNETDGSMEATVNPDQTALNFTNEQLGSLEITKNVQKNGRNEGTGTFYYAVYSAEYDASADPAQVPVRTGSITIGSGDNGTKTATESDLPFDTYYVYELDGNGGAPIVSGIAGVKKVINNTVYTVTGSGTTVVINSTTPASVTLTNNTETVNVPVDKKWVFASRSNASPEAIDATDPTKGQWPQGVSVTVALYQAVGEGEATATGNTVTLTKANPSDTFTNLPKYADATGTEYHYSVVEAGVTGVSSALFTTAVSQEGQRYVITNTEKEAGLTIIKSFTGATLTDVEKSAITFTVTGDGLAAGGVTKTYAEFVDGKWTLTQTDGIQAGKTYTVVESNADIGKYIRTTTIKVNDVDTPISGETITADVLVATNTMIGTIVVINDYTKEKTSISGTKTWVDSRTHNNASEITLKLYRKVEGAEDSTYVEVPSTDYTFAWNGNTYTFSGLDKYVSNDDDPTTMDDEKEYVYKVEETSVNVTEKVNEGTEHEETITITYKSSTSGTNFTNTELTSISKTKAWAGGTWPAETTVTFTLSARVAGVDSYTIVDANGTELTTSDLSKDATSTSSTVTWSNLPKYTLVGEAGSEQPVEIVYTVTESSVTVGTGAGATTYSDAATIADHWTSAEDGNTITNTPSTTQVTGTKTWITNGTPVGTPTVKLFQKPVNEAGDATIVKAAAGTPTVYGSATGADTDVDLQPTWEGNTYTFAGLRKYTDDQVLYEYTVVETEFKVNIGGTEYTYTVGNGTVTAPEGAPSFVVSSNGNNLTNKEVTTASVTKAWEGAVDESKIVSITYRLTRKIGTVEDATFNSDAANTVTVEKAETGTTDWGKTWDNLDAYGIITYTPNGGSETTESGAFVYNVDETQFVVKWGDDDSTRATYTVTKSGDTYTVMNPSGDNHFWKATKSGTAFTNTLDETYLDVIKLWSLNGAPATADTDDDIDEISFYLYRSDNKVIDSATKQAKDYKKDTEHTDGAEPFTITRDGTKGSGEWKLQIAGLEKTDSSGTPYTYWIQEVTVPGYSTTPSITMVSGGNTVNVGPGEGKQTAPAESTITITNSKYSVSLPSTGGPGTTMFYIVGSILTLLALVLLITKKRTEGQGID